MNKRRILQLVLAICAVMLFQSHVRASVVCPGDISDGAMPGEDYEVNVFDLLLVLNNWGTNGPGAEIAAPTNVVDVFDLLDLLTQWGTCAIVPGDVCQQDDEFGGANCQLSDGTGQGAAGILAALSDSRTNFFIAADNFVVAASGSLTTICWYGVYLDFGAVTDCSPGDGDDDFSIKIYLDDGGGTPAVAAFFTQDVGAMTLNVDKQFNGDLIGSISIPVYEYTYSIPLGQQPSLQPDTCYWLEISNNTSGNCTWFWATAPPGDGRSMQRSAANPSYSSLDENDFDLAWCLNLSVGDVAGNCYPFPCFGFCPVICLLTGYFQNPENFGTAIISDEANNGTFATEVSNADNFIVNGAGQSITGVCWWGVYIELPGFTNCFSLPPATSPFIITYWDTNAGIGLPGTIIGGPFVVTPARANTVVLNFLISDVYEFTATHAAVPVADGAEVWVEIQHAGSAAQPCLFLWIDAGAGIADGANAQSTDGSVTWVATSFDMAFRVNVTATAPLPPTNDDCAGATALVVGDPPLAFDSSAYTSGGVVLDPTSPCEIAGGGPFGHDASAWFNFVATATDHTVTLCSSDPAQDCVVTVFEDDCALTFVACDDDGCAPPPPFGPSVVVMNGLTIGRTYTILVDYYSGAHAPGLINGIAVTTP